MLISMAKFAERHGLDVSGALLDVDISMVDRPEKRIGKIDVTIQMPRDFSTARRKALENAAGTCPFKHSFHPDAEISARFRYPMTRVHCIGALEAGNRASSAADSSERALRIQWRGVA